MHKVNVPGFLSTFKHSTFTSRILVNSSTYFTTNSISHNLNKKFLEEVSIWCEVGLKAKLSVSSLSKWTVWITLPYSIENSNTRSLNTE